MTESIKKSYLDIITIILIILVPPLLVTGPAIPDIFISITGLLFLIINFKNTLKIYFFNKIVIFLFVWFLYNIFTSLISINIKYSLESSLFYFRFGFFALAIYYLCKKFNIFLFLLFLSFEITIIFVCFDAIIQFFIGKNLVGLKISESINNQIRVSGMFGDELKLGSFIVRFLPVVIALNFLVLSYSKKAIYNFFFLVLLSGFVIFISGERSALLYFIIFLLTSIIILHSLRKYFIPILISILILIVSLFSFSSGLKERIVNYTLDQTNILEGKPTIFSIQHEAIFITSLKIFKDNIFFGIGPKNFRLICKDKKYQTYSEIDHSIDGCQTHPHNTYVQALVETGLFGFLFFLIFFIFICKKIYEILFIKNKYYYDKLIIFHSFVVIAIFINIWPIVPTGNVFNNWLSIIYFLPLGLLLYSLDLNKDRFK